MILTLFLNKINNKTVDMHVGEKRERICRYLCIDMLICFIYFLLFRPDVKFDTFLLYFFHFTNMSFGNGVGVRENKSNK